MTKEAYYFSHDSNARNDSKILKLRMKMGWEGYGLYWGIIEMLRDANGYKLETDYESIAFALQTHSDCIRNVVQDFDLFIIEHDYFYSDSLINRMTKREAKSKKASEAAKARWSKNVENQQLNAGSNANAMQTHSERNAIKGKERKVKEIKEKESKSNLGKHKFSNSPFADLETFKNSFTGTDYEIADLDFYFEAVKNWAESSGTLKNDWKATARNFMLRDKKEGKLQTKNNNNGLSEKSINLINW
jgi:hypothetical protein